MQPQTGSGVMSATVPTGGARQQYRDLLASLAAKTQTKIPALNGRVEKACKLVLQGDVELQGAGALVHSLSDPSTTYTLEPGHCTCADFPRAPEYLCAHRLAAGFARKLQDLLPIPEQSSHDESVSQPAPQPLPEAAFSLTLKGTLDGIEALFTVRGQTAAEFQANLAAVRGLLDTPQTPPANQGASQGQGKGWCTKHGVQMKLTEKNGKSWWSHRTADGSWCKGR
jgi:hypothetical protein